MFYLMMESKEERNVLFNDGIKGRKEMFYLMMESKEGRIVLFNDEIK